jgi:Protein of unknown function (DUF4239)
MMLPAWLSALVLAAAMLATFALGWRLGRRWPRIGKAPPSRLDDATLAILGLLLAFTFSLALAQHNQRRERAVEDSNAIGNFYTCASLLDEPLRGRLQNLVRRYVERRVMLGRARGTEAALTRELPVISQMHAEMQELVREAVMQKSPVTIPLVNNLNEVTSSHAARLAAVHYRLPWSILAMLAVAAIVSVLIVGTGQGAVDERNLVPVTVFVLLVSMVVWVTLDLNQPRRGAITVSQEPLERLLTTMAR